MITHRSLYNSDELGIGNCSRIRSRSSSWPLPGAEPWGAGEWKVGEECWVCGSVSSDCSSSVVGVGAPKPELHASHWAPDLLLLWPAMTNFRGSICCSSGIWGDCKFVLFLWDSVSEKHHLSGQIHEPGSRAVFTWALPHFLCSRRAETWNVLPTFAALMTSIGYDLP